MLQGTKAATSPSVYILRAESDDPQAGTREASRTARSRQAADRGWTSSTKAAPLHSPHSNPFIFLHTRQSWAGSLMALTVPAPRLRSLDFVRLGTEELGWQGSRANEDRRHAVQWRGRGIQRTDTVTRTSRIGSDTVTTGWRVHRGYFTLRLGLRRHRPLYRPVRCWSRMVRITDIIERSGSANMREQMLRQGIQGNLHYRNFDPRWWCQGATNPHQELDLDYFLRGRRHLRSHHEHRLLRQAGTG